VGSTVTDWRRCHVPGKGVGSPGKPTFQWGGRVPEEWSPLSKEPLWIPSRPAPLAATARMMTAANGAREITHSFYLNCLGTLRPGELRLGGALYPAIAGPRTSPRFPAAASFPKFAWSWFLGEMSAI